MHPTTQTEREARWTEIDRTIDACLADFKRQVEHLRNETYAAIVNQEPVEGDLDEMLRQLDAEGVLHACAELHALTEPEQAELRLKLPESFRYACEDIVLEILGNSRIDVSIERSYFGDVTYWTVRRYRETSNQLTSKWSFSHSASKVGHILRLVLRDACPGMSAEQAREIEDAVLAEARKVIA